MYYICLQDSYDLEDNKGVLECISTEMLNTS